MEATTSEIIRLPVSLRPQGFSLKAIYRGRDMGGWLKGDRVFYWLVLGAALGIVGLFTTLGLFLLLRSWPALQHFGWAFPFRSVWDPIREEYGALPVIFGTLMSSLLAMCLATPLSIAIALFLNELAPKRLGQIISFLVELLAAIPSVVIGLWGIFVLAPLLRQSVYPKLIDWFGFVPLFQGPSYGVGLLTAALILSIMVIPTITFLCREVFSAVPQDRREAAIALGATRWETIRIGVLESCRPGIFAALILGLGRALGETMAVTMVIGNRAQISASLLAPAQTMASVIANEYAEATSDLHLAALGEVGLLLFVVTVGVNGGARLLLKRLMRTGRQV